MKKFIFLIFCSLLYSEVSLGNCTATSFVRDFRDDFRSQKSGFDWCFERVKFWGLDTSDGWRQRFCRVRQLSAYRWSSDFFHRHHEFRSQYASGIFHDFERFYSSRVFRGFGAGVHLVFGSRCDGYDYEYVDEGTDIYYQ